MICYIPAIYLLGLTPTIFCPTTDVTYIMLASSLCYIEINGLWPWTPTHTETAFPQVDHFSFGNISLCMKNTLNFNNYNEICTIEVHSAGTNMPKFTIILLADYESL